MELEERVLRLEVTIEEMLKAGSVYFADKECLARWKNDRCNP